MFSEGTQLEMLGGAPASPRPPPSLLPSAIRTALSNVRRDGVRTYVHTLSVIFSLERHIFTWASYFHLIVIFSLERHIFTWASYFHLSVDVRTLFLIIWSMRASKSPHRSNGKNESIKFESIKSVFNHLIDAGKKKPASIKWEERIDQVRINQVCF